MLLMTHTLMSVHLFATPTSADVVYYLLTSMAIDIKHCPHAMPRWRAILPCLRCWMLFIVVFDARMADYLRLLKPYFVSFFVSAPCLMRCFCWLETFNYRFTLFTMSLRSYARLRVQTMLMMPDAGVYADKRLCVLPFALIARADICSTPFDAADCPR